MHSGFKDKESPCKGDLLLKGFGIYCGFPDIGLRVPEVIRLRVLVDN